MTEKGQCSRLCKQQACRYCFRLLPAAAFITSFISEKKWMKGANDQDLWYDNNKYLAGYVVSENGYLITAETHQMAVL